MLTIKTNHVPRELVSYYELTVCERAGFDYVGDEDEDERYSYRFFRYRGELYDIYEFVRIVPASDKVGYEYGVDNDSPLLKWDGIQTDSYFSGIVARFVDYGHVIAGRVYS